MAQSSLRPFKHDAAPKRIAFRKSSVVSLDLDSEQREFLSLPSPYHDHDSPPSSSHHDANPESLSRTSATPNIFTSFFNHFRYSKVHDAEHDTGGGEDDDSELQERKPKHIHWSEYEETPMDRWWSVLFLLLLLSFLFNIYMIFNGPPNSIPRHPKPKDNPLPHQGFHFKDHGTNYTCYQTHTTSFHIDFKYAVNYAAYNHLGEELQGGSKGVIYTKLGRQDGKVRKAGLAMFHQLECLAQIRMGVQRLKDKNMTDVDAEMDDSHGYWAYCFDYLRQTILCNADNGVEPSKIVGGKWTSDGFGSVKECRDHKWLHEITACGDGGCEGKAFYVHPKELDKIHKEENKEVEQWRKQNES